VPRVVAGLAERDEADDARRMRARRPQYGDVLELNVSLRDIAPPIWRRLRVPAHVSLGGLHDVLQLAFGWKTYHLHDFVVGTVRFGVTDPENQFFCVDEHAAPLGAVARAGAKLEYRYDFGDGWVHDIEVERVAEGNGELVVCTDGARACPPEDCGGVPGYEELLLALANPKHPDHRRMKQWVGRAYDPEKLDLNAVNKKLATLAKRLAKTAKPSPRRPVR
jgi:hypothetical protein